MSFKEDENAFGMVRSYFWDSSPEPARLSINASNSLERTEAFDQYCTFISIVNRVVSGEIYTAGKNFTLPPAVTALTNFTSG